jgi:hypothetical protein
MVTFAMKYILVNRNAAALSYWIPGLFLHVPVAETL